MTIDKRVKRNLASTSNTRKLLKAIKNNPEKYSGDEALIHALKSQGGLAKLEYESEIDGKSVKKEPMSLNTLKDYSDKEFDEGFEGINNLRLKATEAIETYIARSVRPDSRSRVGLQITIHELQEELDQHRSINFILLQAVQSAISTFNSVQEANDPDLREERAKQGVSRLRAILSLNPPPFDDISRPTVVSLKDYKNGK